MRERFPDARVARLDRDTAGSGAARDLDAILRADAGAREIDLLVGTQMVTKGHDFPGVTLVGVLQPDQGMDLPDFRATERTFQLLEQVAGRAGRGERPGRVIIQTYRPEHAAITAVVQHDYDGLRPASELDERRADRLPPLHPHDRAFGWTPAIRRRPRRAPPPPPRPPPAREGRRSACAARPKRRSAGCAAGPAGRSGCRRRIARRWRRRRARRPGPSSRGATCVSPSTSTRKACFSAQCRVAQTPLRSADSRMRMSACETVS